MGGLEEAAAARKIVSALFLSLGSAGRKNVVDKFPDKVVATVGVDEFVKSCTEVLQPEKEQSVSAVQVFLEETAENRSSKPVLVYLEWTSGAMRIWGRNKKISL